MNWKHLVLIGSIVFMGTAVYVGPIKYTSFQIKQIAEDEWKFKTQVVEVKPKKTVTGEWNATPLALKDMRCVSALSVVRDWYFKNNNINDTFRQFTDAQDELLVKYEYGHYVMNMTNIDKQKAKFGDDPFRAYRFIELYCTNVSAETMSNFLKNI